MCGLWGRECVGVVYSLLPAFSPLPTSCPPILLLPQLSTSTYTCCFTLINNKLKDSHLNTGIFITIITTITFLRTVPTLVSAHIFCASCQDLVYSILVPKKHRSSTSHPLKSTRWGIHPGAGLIPRFSDDAYERFTSYTHECKTVPSGLGKKNSA